MSEPPPLLVDEVVGRALAEDLGTLGDITTDAVIPAGVPAHGEIVPRAAGRIAGLRIALRTFAHVDERIATEPLVAEGDRVEAGTPVALLSGPARGILTAERTALNLLGHLSGIATATSRLVELIEGTGAVVTDTRKTTPGLRALEKMAVVMGGGVNHRLGLYDAVLIKDNHIALAGSVPEAVARARASVGSSVKVEVEVESLDQLAEALEAGVDAVLLDNMPAETLGEAVARVGGRCKVEASGGISAENIREVAETGVDVISVGWITHSAPALDVALELWAGRATEPGE